MPLYAQEHIPIPAKDILSWCYEGRASYDQTKPIYVDAAQSSRFLSATHVWSLVRRLIAGFRHAGLEKGDVVCIHCFNQLYYPVLVQGIIGAGGVWVGTNPAYTSYELHHALKVSRAKFIIVDPDLLDAIEKPAKGLGIHSEANVFLFEDAQAAKGHKRASWRSLLDHGEQDWEAFDDLETAKSTTAFLLFSSGTTGLPKAAQLSHYNIIAEHTLVHESPTRPEPFALSRVACLPFFHAAMAPFVHTTVLRSGRPAYVMKRFDLKLFLHYNLKYQVTQLLLVPPMVVAIVNLARGSPEMEEYVRKSLSTILSGWAGAAPLDVATQNELQGLLPPTSAFTQIWAMSETSCFASCLYYPENDDTGSVGRFMPNIDVKLVDGDGVELDPPYGQRGELCVRGPTVIRGYLDNPEANTRDWDNEGFFHTGDILFCSPETRLWYVVDRRKELIKVRGFQVAPNEIEGVLLSHPAIADVAVIGVPTPESESEAPRAYVVGKAGERLSDVEVRKWVQERLAKYKRLDGGVRFVDAIPKSASGKILKRLLREEVRREMGAKL